MTHKWVGIDDGLEEKQYHGAIYDAATGEFLFRVPPQYREMIVAAVNADLRNENEQLRELICNLLNAHESVDDNKDHRITDLPLTENDKTLLRRVLAASEVKA